MRSVHRKLRPNQHISDVGWSLISKKRGLLESLLSERVILQKRPMFENDTLERGVVGMERCHNNGSVNRFLGIVGESVLSNQQFRNLVLTLTIALVV